jgi:hypothetical protein
MPLPRRSTADFETAGCKIDAGNQIGGGPVEPPPQVV